MAVEVLIKPTKRLLQQSLIAATLWSFSAPVFSVSLSEINLDSGLHQPFKATIKLRNFDPVEADRVGVEIANDIIQSQYNSSTYLPAPIDAKLISSSRGTFIELSSPTAIDEPFLKFAVQLSSPSGLILRQYEVLLDPPKSVYNLKAESVLSLAQKNTSLNALEKLKRSIEITETESKQGIELAPVPAVAALKKTPSVAKPKSSTEDIVQSTSLRENSQANVAAPTQSTEPAIKQQSIEKLFTTKEMSTEEFVAALEEYSTTNLQLEEKKVLGKAELPSDQISTFKPEFAALSVEPKSEKPTAIRQQPKAVKTAKAAKSQLKADVTVTGNAFANATADSVARELLAYRERARAGKKASGLTSRELMELSANSVNRVSSDALD